MILDDEDEFRGLGDDLFQEIVVPEKKGPRLKKTKLQKALRVMLKRAGISKPTPLDLIFRNKTGPRIDISEIGFLSDDEQPNELMQEMAKACPVRNRLNRDDVSLQRVLAVGAQVFKAGCMRTPIYLYKNTL